MSIKIELSTAGKRHYKGGNRKPMKKLLGKTFKTKKHAEKYITETLGSVTLFLFKFKKK